MRTIPVAVLISTLLALPLAAQSGMPGFEPTGDFILKLDGEAVEHAEIYKSERAGAYLVMAPEFPLPLLVNLRSRAVERVNMMKVLKKDDGTIDLLVNPVLDRLGPFQLAASAINFSVEGRPARLEEPPWLLELHDGAALEEHSVEYVYKAGRYVPNPGHLGALRAEARDVRVRTYFGSWCPACKRLLPNILRVAGELEGSRIRFEYYGLPKPMTDDPETGRADIRSVPTLIVFEGDKEIGRLSGNDLMAPETALRRLLGAS